MSNSEKNRSRENSNAQRGKTSTVSSSNLHDSNDSEIRIHDESFCDMIIIFAFFILIFVVGIVICFYAIRILPKENSKDSIFLIIIIICILTCLILFHQISRCYLSHNEMIKKIWLHKVECQKILNFKMEKEPKEEMENLRKEILRLESKENNLKELLANELGQKGHMFENTTSQTNYSSAEENYNKSLDYYKQIYNSDPNNDNKGHVANTLYNIARVQCEIAQEKKSSQLVKKAEITCKSALKYYKELDNSDFVNWHNCFVNCSNLLDKINSQIFNDGDDSENTGEPTGTAGTGEPTGTAGTGEPTETADSSATQ